MKKWIALTLCAVLCLGMLAGCSGGGSGEGKLILCTSADYPPFEFHMLDENGKDVIVGIDVSVAEQIAADMGLELEIVDISFDNLLTALDKGEADIALAAMEADPDRENAADFSDPYYTDLPPMILVPAADAGAYASLEDFTGKTVGAQTGTTKEDIVTDQMTGAQLLSLASVTDLVNNLVYGKCDAVVLDGAVAQQYAAANDKVALCAVELGQTVEYCVAVKEGDPKGLLTQINQTIAKLVENGTIDTYIAQAEENSTNALVG